MEALLENTLGCASGVGDLTTILRRDRHRLFAIHILADLERGDGHLLVEVDGRGDDDGVDIFALEQLAIFGVRVRRVAGGRRLIDGGLEVVRIGVADRDYLDAGHFEHVPLEE